ncbi:MAG: peptidylprolyl isomerase [Candidatus Nanopelagicales bacterium]|nr:peptidylprolyl isomerase [Candidatus Nanopelagicales bacterium]
MSKPKKPGTGATNKRRKELAAAKYDRQMARRAERATAARRRRRIGWTVAALLGVVGLGALFLLTRPPSDDTVASPDPAASTPATTDPSPAATADIGCDPAPTPPAEPMQYDAAPAAALEDGADYTLRLQTNCGDIEIATAAADAPQTVNAMLSLAQDGYFDDTICHRVTTENIFVLQCGDPTGTGSGGPGFQLPDENLPDDGEANYPKGTIAMANAGPGTAGSQFFVVYEDTTLPPSYTVWGEVTEGLDVVERVAGAGVAGGGGDGPPAAAIGILGTQVDPALG